jgi:uncharacterized protein
MTDLMCPKCHAPLKSVERNGVTIDRCVECGGVFLDRGELERLMAAETAFLSRDDDRPRNARPATGNYEYDDDDDDDRRRPGQRRKKSFLGDIFDFG